MSSAHGDEDQQSVPDACDAIPVDEHVENKEEADSKHAADASAPVATAPRRSARNKTVPAFYSDKELYSHAQAAFDDDEVSFVTEAWSDDDE